MEQLQVSEDIKRLARLYADLQAYRNSPEWRRLYNAYIAGAASMKPVEHTKEPENETK